MPVQTTFAVSVCKKLSRGKWAAGNIVLSQITFENRQSAEKANKCEEEEIVGASEVRQEIVRELT